MRELRRELSRLPLILRCVVVGGSCAGTIAAVFVVINVIRNYPADHVVQAALFGIVEAFALVGSAGCVLGLVVGIFLYVGQKATRSVVRRHT